MQQSSFPASESNVLPRRGPNPLLRAGLVLSALTFWAAVSLGACGSDTTDGDTKPPPAEPKCGNCLSGTTDTGEPFVNTCVDNACMLVCDSQTDCFNLNNANGYLKHTQDCTPSVADDGAEVSVCRSNGKARGFGADCPFGNECGGLKTCPNGQPCGDACGPDPANVCERDEDGCKGRTDCKLGRCKIDRSPCLLEETCPADQCRPLGCAGFKGEADPGAYCTAFDCTADTDCPGGFYCGVIRIANEICGSNKGKSAFCGETEEPCVNLSDNDTKGTTYGESGLCAYRNACLRRDSCAPCETDLDCSLVPSQKCAVTPGDGAKVCAHYCEDDSDCGLDYTCDTTQGTPGRAPGVCIPRAGKCVGEGKFCDICRSDKDCGPNGVCLEDLPKGQKACFLLPAPSCETNDDCPTSPSGKRGRCTQQKTCDLPLDDDLGPTCW